jgi:hypothetical protein
VDPESGGLPYPLTLEEYLPARSLDYATDVPVAVRFFGATNFLEGCAENGSVRTSLGNRGWQARSRQASSPSPSDQRPCTSRARRELLHRSHHFSGLPRYAGHYDLEIPGAGLRAALAPHVRLAVGDEVAARLPAASLWVLETS